MHPTPVEIRQLTRAIAPELATRAPACVAARCVVPESMAAMVEAGLFRTPQPARVGGYELPLGVLTDAVTAVSEACPSSGWVLMVMGGHHFCLASWPEQAQEDVFGDGRDGLVAGALSWQGKARKVNGGYRVDGRWQFCSGVDRADWVMLGCADAEAGGPGVHVVAPREEIIVDDTWHVLGLQGTGSKDVVARDLFVPSHRAIDSRAMITGASPHVRNHRTKRFQVAVGSMLATVGASAILGSARFALQKFIERTRERRVIITGARKAEHAPTRIRLAEASGEIQCAELLVRDSLEVIDRVCESGIDPTEPGYRARVKWQTAYAVELCRRAVSRLYAGSGAHAVYDSSPLQLAFRNVNVGAQHATLDFETAGEIYGKMRLTEDAIKRD
ncbi:hypothetical protein IMX07_11210 [bacterium]|nr:hypothetical protein [bacterium]